MDKDKLEQTLKNTPNIKDFKWINTDEFGFSRTCEFVIRGVHYKILWYTNLCTLYIGEFELLFDEIRVDGCYPNGFKTNMTFTLNGFTTGNIPIEEYKESA